MSSPPVSVAPLAKLDEETDKLQTRLCRLVGQAIADYRLIEDGDKIMVCLSGGKDSFTLLSLLMELRERAPIDFRIVAMNLDQKQPGFPGSVLPEYLASRGVPFKATEPCTTASTFNSWPILEMDFSLPRYGITVVRVITFFKALIWASFTINSSVNPSASGPSEESRLASVK